MKTVFPEKTKGSIYIVTAAFFYSLFGVFTRLVSKDFGEFSQTWTRGIVIILVLIAINLKRKTFKKIRTEDFVWFLVIGLSIAGVNPTFYIAITHLHLGTSLFVFYGASTIVSYLLGFIFYKEKINFMKMISLILALTGIFLIQQADLAGNVSWYLVAAFLSGSFFGMFVSVSKKLSHYYSGGFINLTGYSLAVPALFIISMLTHDKVTYNILSLSWLYNIIYGFVVIGAFLSVVAGFRYIEVQIGSLLLLSELLFVVTIGVLFYAEVPTFETLIGGAFILFAMALPYMYTLIPIKKRNKR